MRAWRDPPGQMLTFVAVLLLSFRKRFLLRSVCYDGMV